jgi:hypothetical protein
MKDQQIVCYIYINCPLMTTVPKALKILKNLASEILLENPARTSQETLRLRNKSVLFLGNNSFLF